MKEEEKLREKDKDQKTENVEIVTGQQRQLTVIAPLDPQYFAVDLPDWKFLKAEITKLKPAIKWYELVAGGFFGTALGALVSGFSASPWNCTCLWWGLAFLVFAGIILKMALQQKIHVTEKVETVLDYARTIEGKGQVHLLEADAE